MTEPMSDQQTDHTPQFDWGLAGFNFAVLLAVAAFIVAVPPAMYGEFVKAGVVPEFVAPGPVAYILQRPMWIAGVLLVLAAIGGVRMEIERVEGAKDD